LANEGREEDKAAKEEEASLATGTARRPSPAGTAERHRFTISMLRDAVVACLVVGLVQERGYKEWKAAVAAAARADGEQHVEGHRPIDFADGSTKLSQARGGRG